MSRDNWERLVAAVLRKEQLWQLFHQQSRSPSICSEASDFSFSSDHDLRFPFKNLILSGGSSPHRELLGVQVAKLQLLPDLVFFSNFSCAFDVQEVLVASGGYIGEGTFGSVYTAEIDDGLKIVVKRLKLLSVSEQYFKRQMEIVGNIDHEFVVPLRAYYSNIDKQLLLYEHYPTGSVSALLHGNTGENCVPVDWETRLRIATGAAIGISHIHSQNGGKLVHGNIKASNIFLTSQRYGCVSDVGLANMIKTTFMPTARCYAPEIRNTQNVTQESDVYSFGIFIFELLTRKSSIQVIGGHDSVDLVQLVKSVNSKVGIDNVFDKDLLNNPSINEQMVQMLQIGISCVAKSPKKRPKMSDVAKMIEAIGLIGNLVQVLQHVPAFDFKDTVRAPLELLGKGTFGTSYVVRSGNGDTFIVEKLLEVNATKKEVQQHIAIIGRIRHQNVAPIRAYSYTEDEKKMVHDCYDEGIVHAMLQGGRDGGDKISLDWELRLKIALGLARGIAHIHNLKLVHGNITISNIFLNEPKYCCVTDVGLAKLVFSPTKASFMQSSGYCAPELTDTNMVSQASEVYSFGVVLLELLTGKPPLFDDGGCRAIEIISLVSWIHSVRLEWSAEIFDAELLRYRNEEKAVMQVLRIALSCVSFAPKLRPRMAVVVQMLHEIAEPTIERIQGINILGPAGFNLNAPFAPKEFEMEENEWNKRWRADRMEQTEVAARMEQTSGKGGKWVGWVVIGCR